MKSIKPENTKHHGYEPQSKLWTGLVASCWVLYPPLRGIVQLSNSAALRFRNWSFTNKITAAICFSLLLHFALAALLVFGLSGNSISSPKLDGINLVWVSLDAKSHNSSIIIQKNNLKQSLPFLEKAINTENQEPGQILATNNAAKDSTNTFTLAKYDLSGQGAKQQLKNITSLSENQTAGDTYHSHTVIAYPLYKENTPPVYPEIARVSGYEGIVLVFAEIMPDGRVGNIKIRKSSGYAILDQSAIEAVKPWKFEPAKKSGNPFTVWVELPIKFILHNNSQS